MKQTIAELIKLAIFTVAGCLLSLAFPKIGLFVFIMPAMIYEYGKMYWQIKKMAGDQTTYENLGKMEEQLQSQLKQMTGIKIKSSKENTK